MPRWGAINYQPNLKITSLRVKKVPFFIEGVLELKTKKIHLFSQQVIVFLRRDSLLSWASLNMMF